MSNAIAIAAIEPIRARRPEKIRCILTFDLCAEPALSAGKICLLDLLPNHLVPICVNLFSQMKGFAVERRVLKRQHRSRNSTGTAAQTARRDVCLMEVVFGVNHWQILQVPEVKTEGEHRCVKYRGRANIHIPLPVRVSLPNPDDSRAQTSRQVSAAKLPDSDDLQTLDRQPGLVSQIPESSSRRVRDALNGQQDPHDAKQPQPEAPSYGALALHNVVRRQVPSLARMNEITNASSTPSVFIVTMYSANEAPSFAGISCPRSGASAARFVPGAVNAGR